MAIDDYFIHAYWWLFYSCLLVGIIFVPIGEYYIHAYWWVLVVLLLMSIDGYFINGY
jgi:hypothetical protein